MNGFSLGLLAAFVLFAFVQFLWQRRRFYALSLRLKGTYGYPLLGNALQFIDATSNTGREFVIFLFFNNWFSSCFALCVCVCSQRSSIICKRTRFAMEICPKSGWVPGCSCSSTIRRTSRWSWTLRNASTRADRIGFSSCYSAGVWFRCKVSESIILSDSAQNAP